MHFWFKLFCLPLILNNIMMDPIELKFNFVTMGHSGFYISWEVMSNEDDWALQLNFGHRIKDDPKDKNFSFSGWQWSAAVVRGFSIASLKENTFYDIIIQQYSPMEELNEDLSEKFLLEKEYTFVKKTNCKTNEKPAKPSFLCVENSPDNRNFTDLNISWLPCGEERNCSEKEPGSHFIVKSKILDRRGEYSHTELNYAFTNFNIMAGMLYEITVLSVYNDIYTESDPQEFFLKPEFGAVRSVKVVSYPNASILVTWKPPTYLFGELYKYRIIIANDSSYLNNYLTYITYDDTEYVSGISYIDATIEKKLFDEPDYQLVPGVTYIVSILPYGIRKIGLETQVKYTLPVNNDD